MSDTPAKEAPSFRRHHLLALIPMIALLFAPYFANRIEPRILGMPFLLAWIVIWVVITSGIMALMLVLDGDSADRERGQ